MTGKIRMLSVKGFGFIQPSGDVSRESGHFFHARHLDGTAFETLKVGDEVSFDSAHTERGLQAENVRPAN